MRRMVFRRSSAPVRSSTRLARSTTAAMASGAAHGGLLMTLADIALGYNTAYRENPPGSWVTANLTGDFAGAAKLGDWVEAHVDLQKSGKRLAFANAYLLVGEERILRASAVFARSAAKPTE